MSSINIIMGLGDIGLDMLPVLMHYIMNLKALLGSLHEAGNSGSTQLDDVAEMFGIVQKSGFDNNRVFIYLS